MKDKMSNKEYLLMLGYYYNGSLLVNLREDVASKEDIAIYKALRDLRKSYENIIRTI